MHIDPATHSLTASDILHISGEDPELLLYLGSAFSWKPSHSIWKWSSQPGSLSVLYTKRGGSVLSRTDFRESLELERFSVTGSRIKRTEIEGALPVMIFNREDFERSGESSAADFIRSLPVNSFGSWRAAPGNPAQGESHVDLHGVGSERSLVLIDGRRLPKSPLTTASQNIGLIPLAAIERVEVLTDGASAIYGSDAIGGVINIITRDHYRGVELMLGSARSENGESDRDHGYVVGGLSNDPQSCAALNRSSDCSLPVPVEWVISSALTSEQSEQYSLGLVWQPGPSAIPDSAVECL